jgi:DNA-directed RNA polymerase subunit H (RpoH/RPB5)
MEADIELIIRGRPTILDIIENRGYDVTSYKDVHPEDILKFASTNPDLLRIIGAKVPDGKAPMERCVVIYWVTQPMRLRLEQEITKLWDEDNANHYNKATDEIIVIMNEPYHEVFDLTAVKQWNTQKTRISFFHLKNLISNPSSHTFVPPHRKLTNEEIETVISQTHVKAKSEFPHIKYHRDIQARVLGLVPGDVVEIQRPSETCGIYTMYRVCVP